MLPWYRNGAPAGCGGSGRARAGARGPLVWRLSGCPEVRARDDINKKNKTDTIYYLT